MYIVCIMLCKVLELHKFIPNYKLIRMYKWIMMLLSSLLHNYFRFELDFSYCI